VFLVGGRYEINPIQLPTITNNPIITINAKLQQNNITNLDLLIHHTTNYQTIVHTTNIHTDHLRKNIKHHEFYEINIISTNNIFQTTLTNKIKQIIFSSSLNIHCGTLAD
jgi:Nucleoside-diphosphate-sugar epimerases